MVSNPSSDSDDDVTPYDYAADITPPPTPTPVTWEPSPLGVPTMCYCGKPAVLKTQTFGLLTGQKFYSCSGDIRDGDCHIYKELRVAYLEEFALTKTKLEEIEARLFQLGDRIDEEQKKYDEMVNFCKEQNAKIIESTKKEIDYLKEMGSRLYAKVEDLEMELES